MKPGRDPTWNVTADLEPSSWLEAVTVPADGRILLPVMLRKRVSWASPKATIAVLATVRAGSEVSFRPYDDKDPALLAVQAAIKAAGPTERAALVRGAMVSLFRVSLNPDGRLRMPQMLLTVIGVGPEERVWAGAHANLVTLWSDRYWQAVTLSDADLFQRVLSGQ